MKKTYYWQCLFLYFFYNIGSNLAQIKPQDHTQFDLFCWFPIKYFKRFSSCENFLLKPLKITIFLAQLLQKWGPHRLHPKQKTVFYVEITELDHKLSKIFTLLKYHMFLVSYECFSFLYDVFVLQGVISSHNSCPSRSRAEPWWETKRQSTGKLSVFGFKNLLL